MTERCRTGVDDAAEQSGRSGSRSRITGAGNTDEFRTLAAATQTQPPLPAHRYKWPRNAKKGPGA